MPLHEVTNTTPIKGLNRLQIMGPPGSRKTTITKLFDRPCLVVALPGEKHTQAVLGKPLPEGMRLMEFDEPDYSDTSLNWVAVWDDIRMETFQLCKGAKGDFQTVVFDGVHKAAYICYLAAKQKFASQNSDWDGRKGWPWVNDEMLKWFSVVYNSKIPWVFWLVWAAKEQDDQTAAANSEAAKKQSIWPDFMGKFQRTCMGETNIIYQYEEGGQAYWQLRQDEKIKGVGLRVASEKADKLPIRIKADWAKLKEILLG